MTASEAQFEVEVTLADCRNFAELSGDWNPLHTDSKYAADSVYGSQVLHGAFSAGLISQLAGMHLPGRDCLLYGIKLRFVAPILPPAKLLIRGQDLSVSSDIGHVKASIIDRDTDVLYVDASYEFGYHRKKGIAVDPIHEEVSTDTRPTVLVTGASGGLGSALLRQLGARGQAVPRSKISNRLESTELGRILGERRIAAIIHCAWPSVDNRLFIDLDDPERAIDQKISGPLRDIQLLSSVIARHGEDNAPLILIGSTFTKPGRHFFRMPLYSAAKSIIPTLVGVLGIELSTRDKRCFGVVFDVIDGGMNKGISETSRVASADRSPWGRLPTPDDAAEQLIWLLGNHSKLINGSTLTLSGGSIP